MRSFAPSTAGTLHLFEFLRPMHRIDHRACGATEEQWEQLAAAAKAVSVHGYSPYSGFRVGAAVLTAEGGIATGCNVENASFGLSVCAERNAMFGAVAKGAREIVALVVYTPTPTPTTPCGACRQVLAEFGHGACVRCVCDGAAVASFTAGELLPAAFALPAR